MAQIQRFDIQPNPMVPGRPVTGRLYVENPAAVASAKMWDPRGHELRFQRVEESGQTAFVLREDVPADADSGLYYATLVVTETDGNVERKTVELRVA
jgi:hypothetical protein